MFNRNKQYKDLASSQHLFEPHQMQVLLSLFEQTQAEQKQLGGFKWHYLLRRLCGRQVSFNGQGFEKYTLAIDEAQALLLYNFIQKTQPTTIVEFGTSFGFSTIYMAKALQACGQGKLYSIENEPNKRAIAQNNIAQCQLSPFVELIGADALEPNPTLDNLTNIDFVFMDGFPNINLAFYKRFQQQLSANSTVLVDDAILFKKEMKDLLQYLKKSAITHSILKISTGMLLISESVTVNQVLPFYRSR